MKLHILYQLTVVSALILASPAYAQMNYKGSAVATRESVLREPPNIRGLVEIEVPSAEPNDLSLRIAQELEALVDDGSTRRVLPVVGKGNLQTIIDLLYLPRVDTCVMPSDVLDHVLSEPMIPALRKLTYISKLPGQELFLLARPEIKDIKDLNNLPVSTGDIQGPASITAARVFRSFNIAPLTSSEDLKTGLTKLRSGDLAAVAVVAAQATQPFSDVRPEDQLHLLNVDISTTPISHDPHYVSVNVNPDDFPGITSGPLRTLGIWNVLLVADLSEGSERYRNVTNFVNTYFSQFGILAKNKESRYLDAWKTVSIADEIPGLTRFPPAEDWIKHHIISVTPKPEVELQERFTAFLESIQTVPSVKKLSSKEKQELFTSFLDFEKTGRR